jgi:RNA polymerase sigma factor (TIGR02999 family)
MTEERGEITRLADRWSRGDDEAFDRLIELVYHDLRRIAHRHLRAQRSDLTLDTTGLAHEAYLKLASLDEGVWRSRAQFFAFCSRAMRRILIDYARRRRAAKRGGGRVQVPLTDDAASVDAQASELLVVDEALDLLASRNERMARVVECRFYGGLSVPETAEALGTSVRTVEREWTRARVYLRQALLTSAALDEDGKTRGGCGPDGSASGSA